MPFPHQLRVELTPRRIEAELSAYLTRWYDKAVRTKNFNLDSFAREALEHVISRAFLAGKITAAREIMSPWQIVGDDSLVIQNMAEQFENDFERIMRDLRTHLVFHGPQTPRSQILNRFNLLAATLTWKAYNQGKKSEFKRSLKLEAEIYKGAHYKYPGWFMFKTSADEKTCDICAPFSGRMSEDYDELIAETGELPEDFHPDCRCEIVGRPTVPIVERQERFRETSILEQQAREIQESEG